MAVYWYFDDETNDNFGGSPGDDVIYGYGGNDILGGQFGADVLYGGSGDDELYGDEGNDSLFGEAGNDTLFSGPGNDTLDGGIGNDILHGWSGSNILIGGLGDDTFHLYGFGDTVKELAGGGFDKVYVHFNGYTMADQVEVLELQDGATYAIGNNLNNVMIGSLNNDYLIGEGGNDNLWGQDGDDALRGRAGDDGLFGQEGNDDLWGGDNNDWLDGGSGDDFMNGGAGNDTFIVNQAGDIVNDEVVDNWGNLMWGSDAGGIDTVQSYIDFNLYDGGNIENLVLLGTNSTAGYGNWLNNVITGNAGDNLLFGDDGNDTMYGGDGNDTFDDDWDRSNGNDTMYGGTGDDSYYLDSPLDKVAELADQGEDTIYSRFNYTLGANFENLVLEYGGIGNGNLLDNEMSMGIWGSGSLYGFAGNDTLIGGSYDDFLDGGVGVDHMEGGDGNDTYLVDNTNDTIVEIADQGWEDAVKSTVSYTLSDHIETLTLMGIAAIDGTGNGSDNHLVGNSGNNILSGMAGNDGLEGMAGNDTIEGGDGDDHIEGGLGNDQLLGGTGFDRIYGDAGDDIIDGGDGESRLIGGLGNDTITGGVDNDRLWGGDGNDILNAGGGVNRLYGGAGNDILTDGDTNGESLTTMQGGAGDDQLYGGGGNDDMYGGDGNDLLDGGAGADYLYGGAGNDTYIVDDVGDNGGEYIIENDSNDRNRDSGGIDTVRSSIEFNLFWMGNVENLILTGDETNHINGWGNLLDNTITGNDGNNFIEGNNGNDLLYGGGGNDTFDNNFNGTGGNDTMYGGDGDDAYYINWGELDKVIELADQGNDTVYVRGDFTLGSNLENLFIENGGIGKGNELNNTITSTSYSSLYGFAGDDTLTGSNDEDFLDGGTGNDTMRGGEGHDTYMVDSAFDIVEDADDEHWDWVQSTVTYALPDYIDMLTLLGTAAVNGTGNSLNNDIIGNINGNILTGNEGDDYLSGEGGNDTLSGGAGYDRLFGGAGNDTLHGGADTEGNYLIGGDGNDTIYGSDGADHLDGETGNDTLSGGGENDHLQGGAGNDIMDGGAGHDYLDGGIGGDTMSGGADNDTYIVDSTLDTVSESEGGGDNDHVNSKVTFTLSAHVEHLALEGAAAINGTGNTSNNYIDGNSAANILDGRDGDDHLESYAGIDTLYGGAGNDWLDGGLGNDKMFGGSGTDMFMVDSAGDVVTEADEGGQAALFDGATGEWVVSSVSYSLPLYVENLLLLGGTNINGTGNSLDNTIFGNYGNNILNGGLGDDTLRGNGGDDTYWLDSTGDIVDERQINMPDDDFPEIVDDVDAGGNDTIITTATSYDLSVYRLGGSVVLENLTLIGVGASTGYGNDLDNIMTGNGSSELYGGNQNDTYIIKGGDVVHEDAGNGVDTIRTYIEPDPDTPAPLAANVENLILEGAVVRGDGNELDNKIFGNNANNLLWSGAGNDLLNGGKGNDRMMGCEGDDTYWVDSIGDIVWEYYMDPDVIDWGGYDQVFSTVTHTLGLFVEELHLTGIAAINGTGNDVDNSIFGNSKTNILSGLGGNDVIHGLAGNDTLNGGAGGDELFGDLGNDILKGDSDADTLHGGEGNDILSGGMGNDTFVFETALSALANKDTITDFTPGGDTIDLAKSIFTFLPNTETGVLNDNNFKSGAGTSITAADENDFILYNTTSGALFYDADGDGAGVAIQFATLTGSPDTLAASDFMVTVS